eukprot:CAMPEP_0198301480 /NCGR_PEP_ID=MMETSP1449-20131203/51743_1 /TAXON_ID=420275 /ORGANISM="Attheya septentrionalis, Strain CCMP2084" /LENGTH=683 /DNA_ID=CAMNT_0044003577 /DNA_START=105 /DNA_END=2156 /DNA_ORIENTATION=-
MAHQQCTLPVWPAPKNVESKTPGGTFLPIERLHLPGNSVAAATLDTTLHLEILHDKEFNVPCRGFLMKAFERFKTRAFSKPFLYREFRYKGEAPYTDSNFTAFYSVPRSELNQLPQIAALTIVVRNNEGWCDDTNEGGGNIRPEILGSGPQNEGYRTVDESYEISVYLSSESTSSQTRSNIQIVSASPVGALRALSSLGQLLHSVPIDDQKDSSSVVTLGICPSRTTQAATSTYKALFLEDAPLHAWRGLLVDSARHFLPLKDLKRLVSGLEALKFNVLHWHLADAQSFPFVSKTWPKLSEKGAYDPIHGVYTPEDVAELVRYAADMGVRVVPEMDVPGHTSSWGVGYPELTIRCPKEVHEDWWGNRRVPLSLDEHGVDIETLNPLKNFTYEFIEALFINDVFPAFPDPFIHVGGDEVFPRCLQTSPEINLWMQSKGLGRTNFVKELQGMFEARLMTILKKGNKLPVMWNDVLGMKGQENLPKGAIIQWWNGGNGVPQQAQAIGADVIASLGWYLDNVGKSWVDFYNVKVPAGAVGGEACSWGEHSNHLNMDQRIFGRGRLAAVAERLWSQTAADRPNPTTIKRLGATLCRMNQERDIGAGPAYPDFCAPLRVHDSDGLFESHNVNSTSGTVTQVYESKKNPFEYGETPQLNENWTLIISSIASFQILTFFLKKTRKHFRNSA